MKGARRVVCPGCDSAVRAAPGEDRCPRCGDRLFTGKPLTVDRRGLDQHLKKSDVPVLVDFWAPGCGPCKMLAGVLAKLTPRLEPRLRVLKVNLAETPQVARRHRVQGVPTLVLFRRGRELGRRNGALDARRLEQWLDKTSH